MSTASWVAASASSRRPRLESDDAEVVQAHREIGEEGVGSRLREAPIDVDGLLGCGQRLLAASEVGEHRAEVVQARREIGEEGVGSRLREAPLDVEGLLACGQRLLAAPEVGETVTKHFEAGGEMV